MTAKISVQDWLITAMEEPLGRINETYYYDRRANEFFSIFITDYFLLSGLYDSPISSPYTPEELATLKDRAGRIESNESSILGIPRLTVIQRKQILKDFFESGKFNLDKANIQAIIKGEDGTKLFDLGADISGEIKREWNTYKTKRIIQIVETFCNLNLIDPDSASLFTDEKVTSMNLALAHNSRIPVIRRESKKQQKPWWKFWK